MGECKPLDLGDVDWRETLFLNIIAHTSFSLTVAVCSRRVLYTAVGRCRLAVSKPVFKAPMVSALEATNMIDCFILCFQIQLAPLHRGGRRRGWW